MKAVYKIVQIAVIVNGILQLLLIASLFFTADGIDLIAVTMGLGFVCSVLLLLLPLIFQTEVSPVFYYLIAAVMEMLFPIAFFMWMMGSAKC